MNATEIKAALAEILSVIKDARNDEEADAMTVAGGYLFGDVMSEAIERAEAVLAA